MEKNFDDQHFESADKYRYSIEDNGFSDDVMARIEAIARPSRNIYRVPTLITAATVTLVITTLSATLGTDFLAKGYENLTISITEKTVDGSDILPEPDCSIKPIDDSLTTQPLSNN